jgi:hypothetical protein
MIEQIMRYTNVDIFRKKEAESFSKKVSDILYLYYIECSNEILGWEGVGNR